ncbi:hypothetical protein LTR84_006852 [Exophiala bonariae]|uniref:NAD-dependent epimerase/dehydratase domain-containing protein n=1 Tax=Exophiala bonariae TaxID=1690606 RepID=A0AAV9N376_9EURO|nr:hypothetical protein LTR84_006852 [Exophiala bonariae]
MAGELVLITGGNGHIGFRVVAFALKAGYHVRAAVRSQEKADLILAAPSIKELNPGKSLTFIFVPDLLQPGAYKEAVKGVDYIIHVASPINNGIPEDKYESHLIRPAIAGTLGILEAAKDEPKVQRIVITSSVVAIVPWYDFFEAETGKVFNEHSRTSNPTGPYKNEFEAYSSGKVQALNATFQFLEENKPHFDVVHVGPTFTIGKDELVSDVDDITRGTNGAALRQILGDKQSWATPSNTVHVEDTALAHVKGLEPHIPSGFFLLTQSAGTEGTTWGDAIEIVNRRFPGAVKAGILPNDGFAPTKHTILDTSETKKLLGYEFKTYEEQVVSVVEHYLQLRGFEEK